MKDFFADQIKIAETISSDGDLRLHVVSTIRLMLQQTAYGLLEWASRQPPPENVFLKADVFSDIYQPSDGSLITILESTAIYCEQLGWNGVSRVLFCPIPESSASIQLCNTSDPSVLSLLRGLVSLRNDGAEGHGLVGAYNREIEIDCLRQVANSLSSILPTCDKKNGLQIGVDNKKISLRLMRLISNNPVLIRKIKRIDRQKIRIDGQYIDDKGVRQDISFEADNFFSALNSASAPQYMEWPNTWSPFCYIPDRMTDSFQGRGIEQNELAVWMDDEDSRACLLYGDGGVGKTTLAVEFMHRYLDEDPDLKVEWKPKYISFYTAKKWRWGINGVELITSGQPNLLGLLVHLHQLMLGRQPSEEFYRLDASAAAMKLQQLIANELGIKRDEHLVIIDNTETLLTSDQETERLGKELRDISKRVGRVIVTSRRREMFEAKPIGVDKFSTMDAVALIKSRASLLKLKSISQAKDEKLIDVVKELSTKPIVLEAFVQVLTDPTTNTIEKALVRVKSMLRSDLGDFLFADAWSRYSIEMKKLLLLMSRVADVHDSRQFSICCEISGLTLQAAEEGIEESKGIASITRLTNGIEIAFSSNFLEFCTTKTLNVAGVIYPLDSEIDKARKQYRKFVEAVSAFSGDRIAPAFRTPLAKAAHKARREGNYEEALRLFHQAIQSDSNNGWLFDRFAFFLHHDLRDNNAAYIQVKRATELLSQEGEVWFTRGLIESRLGLYRQCEASLSKASSLGIEDIRCSIQRSWAYLKTSPAQLSLARFEISKINQAHIASLLTERNRIELDRLNARLDFLDKKGRNVRGGRGSEL